MSVLLSDDELVAIASREGKRWMGPLPTVDESEAASLWDAAERGARSLSLRGGTGAVFGGECGFDDFASAAVGATPRALGYVVTDDDWNRSAGPFVTVFEQEGGRLLVVTTSDGVSDIRSVTLEEAIQFLDGFATGIRNWEGEGQRAGVILFPHDLESGRALRIDRSILRDRRYDANGFDATELEEPSALMALLADRV